MTGTGEITYDENIENPSLGGGELLQHAQKLEAQSPEITEEVDKIEAEVRTFILGIPLPWAIFKPGMQIEELQKMRDQAANDNDPSLIQEKKSA